MNDDIVSMDSDIFLDILINGKYSDVVDYIRSNREYLSSMANIILDRFPSIVSEFSGISCEEDIDIPLTDVLEIASEFLEFVNPIHKENFDKLINDGSFKFIDIDSEENEHEDKIAYFAHLYFNSSVEENDYTDNLHYTLNIPITHTISDVFTIIHEYFHYDNDSFDQSTDRFSLTEAISISFELILYDFLVKSGVDKNIIIPNICARFENVHLVTKNLYSFLDKLEDYDYQLDDFDLNSYNFESNIGATEDIESVFKYFIGGILGMDVYYKYKNEEIDVANLDNWSKYVNNYDNFESLQYLFGGIPTTDAFNKYLDFFEEDVMSDNILK